MAISKRDAMWTAMRQLGSFTLVDVSRAAKATEPAATDYVKALVLAGIVADSGEMVMGPRGRTRKLYRLARDMGVDAPRVAKDGRVLPPSGRQRMWRAMGILKEFSPRDLAITASLPEAPVAVAEAVYYCVWLTRGRYLRQAGAGRYVAIEAMRTGARAPLIQRIRRLVDANTGEIMAESAPAEEAS
ncbi:hypothetical protein G3N56_06010 [Desulfovibrio sulfodismutans]|uniref:Uncharacterized protein n=1 Tax=Desulfolutivibrio sulfodismutans TaxID=63561 RepID=A0A7K3NM72_9BACT|nr:hypothetical protein [Desulfolutivibrio sulfodismutans]NDY56299.1 hypothetical protein [Desulfolutivibrio sulfodismutans]QLA13574.1 hypothetical protein GD606_15530 [Desulfolutivibrio sulfodismutans DSM 3696]